MCGVCTRKTRTRERKNRKDVEYVFLWERIKEMGDSHDRVSGIADKGDQHGGSSHAHWIIQLPPTDGYDTGNRKFMNTIYVCQL